MAERTKIGLLGAGYILDSHATALAAIPSVTLHAVCDLAYARAERAARKFAIPVVSGSITDLAASDCEAVHVLLPPPLHVDAARTLIERGISVFLEKPMGLNSVACAGLCTLAEEKRVTLGVNHNFLFSRGYESLRAAIRRGELGRIDHVSANWHFGLPLLQFGPFDNWILAAPANIMFELGSHLSAFIVDLLGAPVVDTAVAANPMSLPNGQKLYRHYMACGHAGAASFVITISISAGHADRLLRVRGRGGSAQLDFGRDILVRESTVTDNPILDSYHAAAAAARSLHRQAVSDAVRRVRAALAKGPDVNPFEDSVARSISSFYSGNTSRVDPRHEGKFGTDVIRLCEAVTHAAGVGAPSRGSISVQRPAVTAHPTVLLVGGTGFIGRRLVRMLVDRGHRVRILTRNQRAAAIEFQGLDVDLAVGSHGDRACVERALEGISAVYHLAKCEGKRWQDYLDGDVGPTRVLAEAALGAQVARFLYTGTIASYASVNPREVIDNNTPLDPAISRRSHYPRSKAACEALLQELRQRRGLPLVILRPGIVIGPGSPPAHPGVGRFTSETRVEFWGDGAAKLPLVLVDDVADALARALDAQGIEGQTLLLTSPPLLTAREYVDAVATYMGAQIDAVRRSALRNWMADMTKELAKNAIRHPNRRWPSLHDWQCQSHLARYDSRMTEQVLGWRPVSDRETMVTRGIRDAVDWFLI